MSVFSKKCLRKSGPQPENIPWCGKKYFKGEGQTYVWEGQKYTKNNKINNNSEILGVKIVATTP